MRKTGLLFLAVFLAFGAAMTLSVETASAKCGAFDLLQGDDFCVRCPSVRPEKVYMCPGGPAGMAVAQAQHANCSISFYDQSCGDRMRRKKPH